MATLSLMARIGLDGSGYFLGMKKAEGAAKQLARELSGSLKGSIAAAFGTAAIVEYTRRTIEFASHLQDMSDRVDVSTDALQEWGFAAKQNGSNIDEVVGFFEKLGVAREKALSGNQEFIASFKKLGVATGDLKKKRLEDLGMQVGKTIQNGDVQNLIGALKSVGGKGAGALVPTFKSDLEAMAADARRLGAVMRAESIEKLKSLGDQFDILAMRLRGPFADAISATLSVFKMLGTGIAAISQFIGVMSVSRGKDQTAGKGMSFNGGTAFTPFGNNVSSAQVSPSQNPESQWAEATKAFNKVFKDAAEQELKDDEEMRRRAALRKKAQGDATSAGNGHADKPSVNSLQQIGAYIGGANPMLQTAQKSEGHLKVIRDAILKRPVIASDEGIFA